MAVPVTGSVRIFTPSAARALAAFTRAAIWGRGRIVGTDRVSLMLPSQEVLERRRTTRRTNTKCYLIIITMMVLVQFQSYLRNLYCPSSYRDTSITDLRQKHKQHVLVLCTVHYSKFDIATCLISVSIQCHK